MSVTRPAPVEESFRRSEGRSKSGFTDGFSVEIFFDPFPARRCREEAADYTAPRRTAETVSPPRLGFVDVWSLASVAASATVECASWNSRRENARKPGVPLRLEVGGGRIAEERHLARGHDRDGSRRRDANRPACRGRSSSAEFVGGRASTVDVSAESRGEVSDLATRKLETAHADTVRCQPEVSPT